MSVITKEIFIYILDAGAQCSICMDDFELSQTVRKLPCDHMYHIDCIKKWLEMVGTFLIIVK